MSATDPDLLDWEHMAFEEAQERLEQVVGELESGRVHLDRALALYELGLKLREVCRQRLQAAEGILERLVEQPDGTLTTEEMV